MIIAVDGERPSLELLQLAYKTNKDGAGIAWIDNGVVHFIKGLAVNHVYDLAQIVPTPFVVHFRICSVGKASAELCHPFPISASAPTISKGTARSVLFHNGHWTDWENCVLKHAIATCREIPDGQWSDSRAAAWIAYRTGPNVLRFISGKFAVINPEGIKLYGDGWVLENGIHFSNKWFDNKLAGFFQSDYEPVSYRRNYQPSEVKAIGNGSKEESLITDMTGEYSG